jgi:hypothetical protein
MADVSHPGTTGGYRYQLTHALDPPEHHIGRDTKKAV